YRLWDRPFKNDSNGDGLFGRFLMAAPKPSIPLANEIKQINIDEPSLTHLLWAIRLFNSSEKEPIITTETQYFTDRIMYMYSTKALAVLNEKWDHYVLFQRESLEYDSFLTSIYAKAKVQINRIAGALYVAKCAGEVIDAIAENDLNGLGYYDFSKNVQDKIRRAVKDYKAANEWKTVNEHSKICRNTHGLLFKSKENLRQQKHRRKY
ncbi:unnamed protein product, partial [Didymodactylos carnosus]